MSYLNGQPPAPPPRVSFIAYVDIVRLVEGKRADDRLRVTVRADSEAEAAEKAIKHLRTAQEGTETDGNDHSNRAGQ